MKQGFYWPDYCSECRRTRSVLSAAGKNNFQSLNSSRQFARESGAESAPGAKAQSSTAIEHARVTYFLRWCFLNTLFSHFYVHLRVNSPLAMCFTTNERRVTASIQFYHVTYHIFDLHCFLIITRKRDKRVCLWKIVCLWGCGAGVLGVDTLLFSDWKYSK